MSYAQKLVITPLRDTAVLRLDATGNINITVADLAKVTSGNPNNIPRVTLSQTNFNCLTRGLQKVAVIATDDSTSVSFNQPYGLAEDVNGNFYIADSYNHLIRKINVAGIVSTFAGSGKEGSADGLGTAASFDQPSGIAIDAAGFIYVSDQAANVVRKISAAGLVTTFAGKAYVTDHDVTSGLGATLANPVGIAVDPSGNLFVADATSNCIRKVSSLGVITTFAGGIAGFQDGTGSAAQFTNPYGITIDQSGNLYVTDTYYSNIRKITPAAVVTTIAGNTVRQHVDGLAANASFNLPNGIAVDANGVVYIADTQNQSIRMIKGGIVYTLAGLSGAKGDKNGFGSMATFNTPVGICVGNDGNLYISDAGNNIIRKITGITGPAGNGTVSNYAGIGIVGAQNGSIYSSPALPVVDTIPVRVLTSLKILTVLPDDVLSVCTAVMPNYIQKNVLTIIDNCNDNVVFTQVPAPGSPLKTNTVIPVLIVAEDATGTMDTIRFKVTVNGLVPTPLISITSPTNLICANGSTTFTATVTNAGANPTYQWTVNGNNAGANSNVFTPAALFDKDVIACNVVSDNDCHYPALSQAITVYAIAPPDVIFNPDNIQLKLGDSLRLNPIINGQIAKYHWVNAPWLNDTTASNPVASPKKTTTYLLEATTETGCVVSGTITITVYNPNLIPNAFTPNGDSINDYWDIPALIGNPNCTVLVFNRYGQQVFYSKGYPKPWDGTYKGTVIPPGTYYYLIDLSNGKPKLSGSLTLIR